MKKVPSKIDRGAVMRRAWALRKSAGLARLSMGDAMRQAWAEARATQGVRAESTLAPVAIKPTLTLPPVVAAGLTALSTARAVAKGLRGARVQVGARVTVDLAVRITPRDDAPLAWGTTKSAAVVIDHTPTPAIEHRV